MASRNAQLAARTIRANMDSFRTPIVFNKAKAGRAVDSFLGSFESVEKASVATAHGTARLIFRRGQRGIVEWAILGEIDFTVGRGARLVQQYPFTIAKSKDFDEAGAVIAALPRDTKFAAER